MKIKAPKDFWSGLMFIAFGVGFMIVARNYAMGTAVRMGPAYFPTVLGGILALIGLAIFAKSFVTNGPPVPRIVLRPMTLIIVAIVLFGVFLKPLGLIVCTAHPDRPRRARRARVQVEGGRDPLRGPGGVLGGGLRQRARAADSDLPAVP